MIHHENDITIDTHTHKKKEGIQRAMKMRAVRNASRAVGYGSKNGKEKRLMCAYESERADA